MPGIETSHSSLAALEAQSYLMKCRQALLPVCVCLVGLLPAQVPLQAVEFRASTFGRPSLQILTGDFSGRGTGDVLVTEAEVRNWATAAFEAFAQDSQGRMIRVLDPTTNQPTNPVAGPLFLEGSPIAVPVGQDPAAIVQIAALALDADGVRDDVTVLTSTGKLYAFRNGGHSAYVSGFAALGSANSFLVHDFLDPANGLDMASTHPVFSALVTGDFDHNGGDDIAVAAFGLSNIGTVGVGGVTHTSFGIQVFWCRHTLSGTAVVPSPGDFHPVPQGVDLATADALDMEWVGAAGPVTLANRGTLYVLGQQQCTPISQVGASSITSLQFDLVESNGTATVLVPTPQQTVPLWFPGRVTSMAVGRFDQDAVVDFCVSGNSSNCTPSATVSGLVQFLLGQVTTIPATPSSPARTLVSPNVLSQWLQVPSNAATGSFDLQGLQVADLDGDGQLDVGGLLAYGADLQVNPSAKTADYGYWLGPIGPTSQNSILPTNVYFPLLYSFWSGLYPHYLAAPKATQVFDFDRDRHADVFVAGVPQPGATAQTPYPVGGGFEILKNVSAPVPSGSHVRDYGAAETAPQGNIVREILLGLRGGRPVPGAQLQWDIAGLSSGQLVALFLDTVASSLSVPVPTLNGAVKNVMIHALPQVVTMVQAVPTTVSPLGDHHSHFVRGAFEIPPTPVILGFQANAQCVLLDPGSGAWYGSQGVELLVGN